MKKFKPPSFTNGIGPPSSERQPPFKRQKLTVDDSTPSVKPTSQATGTLGISRTKLTPVRKPLLTLNNSATVTHATQTFELTDDGSETYFNVVWRKPTNKKHKTWDGDGILLIANSYCTIHDSSGKEIARGRLKTAEALVGDILSIGGKECELESELDRQTYLSGKMFLKGSKQSTSATTTPIIKTLGRAQFKNPLLNNTVLAQSTTTSTAQPRHDPTAPNALVLSKPKSDKRGHAESFVDVVVDPYISQFLRPHQREGVSFMYDCIMRFKDYNGAGAILADEMGLGKTLQTIALIWTLLKQHFIPGQGPLAKKVLIVCPVTLTNNWRKEFRKWLGGDRIGVFVVDSKANLRDFICGKVYQVMIIGYEKLRLVQETDELKNANFDVIICDEGHKLKSANNKAAQAIKTLKTTRRIILSGTPIQNDLGEFFVMIEFVNPGLLGTYQTFKREFENPILKARLPDASKKDKEKGAERSAELSRLTEMFILRRTSDLLTGYLPPKSEYVVFCKPTDLQVTLHERLLNTPAVEQCLGGQNSAFQLKGIMHLRKICNSPSLLSLDNKESPVDGYINTVQDLLKSRAIAKQSGKLLVLERFLLELSKTDEKIVLVSQFTQTLGVIQDLLDTHNMTYCRLDGSTASNKRQAMVDQFNRLPAAKCFAFLLSTKSGGCGLNLIGASRLVLFDTDWNPSVDLQAMARVHRDGQKRPVFIYRFLTTGMIDEKIYQRQVTKQGLSDSLMDAKASGSSFSLEELRDLFRLHTNTDCMTHDMLTCTCRHDGQNQLEVGDSGDNSGAEDEDDVEPEVAWVTASQVIQQDQEPKLPKQTNMKALRIYDHVSADVVRNEPNEFVDVIGDDILQSVLHQSTDVSRGCISYVFVKKHGLAPATPDDGEAAIEEVLE